MRCSSTNIRARRQKECPLQVEWALLRYMVTWVPPRAKTLSFTSSPSSEAVFGLTSHLLQTERTGEWMTLHKGPTLNSWRTTTRQELCRCKRSLKNKSKVRAAFTSARPPKPLLAVSTRLKPVLQCNSLHSNRSSCTNEIDPCRKINWKREHKTLKRRRSRNLMWKESGRLARCLTGSSFLRKIQRKLTLPFRNSIQTIRTNDSTGLNL